MLVVVLVVVNCLGLVCVGRRCGRVVVVKQKRNERTHSSRGRFNKMYDLTWERGDVFALVAIYLSVHILYIYFFVSFG